MLRFHFDKMNFLCDPPDDIPPSLGQYGMNAGGKVFNQWVIDIHVPLSFQATDCFTKTANDDPSNSTE
jgi:hypothetical protein